MKKILLFAMATVAFASCEKNIETSTRSQIDLLTGIEGMSRTPQLDGNGNGNFVTGDIFTLTVAASTKQVHKNYAVGETTLYWQDLGIEDSKVTFAGCYPNQAETAGQTFKFNAKSASYADLLLAPAVEVPANTKTIVLPFRHAMHKLVVKYISDGSYTQDELKEISTTLYANTTCTVDLTKGAIVSNSAETPANYATKNGTEVSWLAVPQSTGVVKLSISFNGQVKEFTLPAQTTEGASLAMLEGGKILTVTLQVCKDGISFGNVAIGGWEEQGSAEGDIIM